jgi:hypothetical protein
MEKRGVISEDDTPDYSDEGGRYAAPADRLTKAAEEATLESADKADDKER